MLTLVLPWLLSSHLPQEGSLLGEDELLLLGIAEIFHPFLVAAQPRTVLLVGRQTFEGDQPESDIVGAFMRHPVAEQIAAAFRDDGEPALGVFLEHRALERIDLVADENGDGHGNLSNGCNVIPGWSEGPDPKSRDSPMCKCTS